MITQGCVTMEIPQQLLLWGHWGHIWHLLALGMLDLPVQ